MITQSRPTERCPMASSDLRAAQDLARAEVVLERRAKSSLTFRSARSALVWYYEARERLQAAHSLHPRGELHKGEIVRVSVDGGRGGDLDEVLATLCTIARALADLTERMPYPARALSYQLQDGLPQKEIAKLLNCSQQQVSIEVGKAESFLAGALLGSGVVA
jgi:DNA-directed RNA polymerase specialized sigma24 family protein